MNTYQIENLVEILAKISGDSKAKVARDLRKYLVEHNEEAKIAFFKLRDCGQKKWEALLAAHNLREKVILVDLHPAPEEPKETAIDVIQDMRESGYYPCAAEVEYINETYPIAN